MSDEGNNMQSALVRFITLAALIVWAATAVSRAQAPTPAPGSPRPPVGPQMRGDGPAPTPKPFNITRIDPALDAIVSPNAKLEVMATGFGINEGVLWIREGNSGYLLLSSLIDNVMYKI